RCRTCPGRRRSTRRPHPAGPGRRQGSPRRALPTPAERRGPSPGRFRSPRQSRAPSHALIGPPTNRAAHLATRIAPLRTSPAPAVALEPGQVQPQGFRRVTGRCDASYKAWAGEAIPPQVRMEAKVAISGRQRASAPGQVLGANGAGEPGGLVENLVDADVGEGRGVCRRFRIGTAGTGHARLNDSASPGRLGHRRQDFAIIVCERAKVASGIYEPETMLTHVEGENVATSRAASVAVET